jgi:hypothetical protein
MASTDDELQNEVRELTDYTSTSVFSESALDEVFEIAKRDIQGEANTTINSWYDDLDKENSLFWTACLFTKIKAGELDGVPMSLGDIDYDSLKSSGSRADSKPMIWYEKAKRYTDRLVSSGGRFASTRINRGQSRKYGSESDITDEIDYGGDN